MQQNEKVFEINTHLWGQNSISVGILSDDIYSQPNVLKLNEWNHITITFDGSDSFDTNTLKIFHLSLIIGLVNIFKIFPFYHFIYCR